MSKLTRHEDLIAVILKAYKANHADEFNGLMTRTPNEDGSVSVKFDGDMLVKLIDKAVTEYAAKVEEFDAELARVIRREQGGLFVLDASDEFIAWTKELV